MVDCRSPRFVCRHSETHPCTSVTEAPRSDRDVVRFFSEKKTCDVSVSSLHPHIARTEVSVPVCCRKKRDGSM